MDACARHIIGGLAKYTGAVVGTIFCLQMVLWEPPAFTGGLEGALKKGEKAAKDTQKAGKKALRDTEKAAGKPVQDTKKAGGKALRDTQKAGGKVLQDTRKSSKRAVAAKKRGQLDPPASEPPTEVAEEPPTGIPPTEVGEEPPAGEPPTDVGGEPTSYPNEQRGEPKKAPEFSLGSTEPSIQGDDRSVYERLGISGLDLPEGATGQETQGADVPQDEQVPENQSRSRK